MASLVTDELARRDATLGARSSASGRASYATPAERAAAAKQDSLDAYRDSVLAQRASEAELRAKRAESDAAQRAIYQDRMGAFKDERLKQLETAQSLQQAKADLAAQEQATKDARALAITTDAIGFLKDARGMNPASPEFDTQLQALYAGYPQAAAHPSVERWQNYHLPLRQKYVEDTLSRAQPPKPRDLGTTTTTTKQGDDGAVSKTTAVTRPIPAPGTPEAQEAERQAREDLLRQHDELEAKLRSGASKLSGKPKSADVVALNGLKRQLGYDPLNEFGTPIPGKEKIARVKSQYDKLSEDDSLKLRNEWVADKAAGKKYTNQFKEDVFFTWLANEKGFGNESPSAPTPAPTPAAVPVAQPSAPAAPSLKPLTDDLIKSARAAITAGKDSAAVAQRLKENGYDPAGL